MPDRPRVNRTDPSSTVEDVVDELEEIGRRSPSRAPPPVRGARAFTAFLPNGRSVSLRISPALAPVAEANHLAQFIDRLGEQREATLEAHQVALRLLSRKMASDLERLRQRKLRKARRLRRWLIFSNKKLSQRISKETQGLQAQVREQRSHERTWVRRLLRQGLWDQIAIASSAPLFAAYGQKNLPWAANNTALTLSLGTWLVGDEFAELLSGPRNELPYVLRDSGVWSYLAPFGNVLSGWWLMRGRQHERFISGVAVTFEFESTLRALPSEARAVDESVFTLVGQVDLSPFIAPEHFPDFETFSGIPAVATMASMQLVDGLSSRAQIRGLTAKVERGVLILTITVANVPVPIDAQVSSVFSSLVVAWVVDTAEPPSSSQG